MSPMLSASSEDIARVMDKLEPALVGFPKHHVLFACLSLALLLQDPDIDIDNLQLGVMGVSAWITDFLTEHQTENGTDGGSMTFPQVEEGKMN